MPCLSGARTATELTFRTLFRTSEAILEEPPTERGGGSDIQTMSCATTRCCYAAFLFITTPCQL
jgi:hypothetical protein